MQEFDSSFPDYIYDDLAWIGLMGDGQVSSNTGLPSNPTEAWKFKPKKERLRIIKTWQDLNKNKKGCEF